MKGVIISLLSKKYLRPIPKGQINYFFILIYVTFFSYEFNYINKKIFLYLIII